MKWPANKIQYWPVDRLVPYGRNARTHSEAQVLQLVASMEDFGWTTPVSMNVTPTLIHVDIGATGEWGTPSNHDARDRWPDYHRNIWSNPRAAEADLYMVDGRFRVACFMQILLRCDPDALIMVHDFKSRQPYHVVREVAREIAAVEDMSVFLPLGGGFRRRAREILSAHQFDWS